MARRARAFLKRSPDADAASRLSTFLETDEATGDQRDRDERELLENVLKLRNLRVDDVMVPRADIVAIERGASLDETLATFRENTHSRLPVFRETLDDPVGVVHLKDLALSCGFGARINDFALADHARPLLVVPPSMRVQALLERMQATRRHMALVIDEYGGVDGLVTIEDVIEQIVGEIEDEHDDAEGALWVEQAPGCYLIEARADVSEFEGAAGVKLLRNGDEEEIDTLGGVVFMLSGRVPERGEVILHPDGHEIEIVDADARRIKRVRLRIANEPGCGPTLSSDPALEAAAAAAALATLDGAAAPGERVDAADAPSDAALLPPDGDPTMLGDAAGEPTDAGSEGDRLAPAAATSAAAATR